MGKRKKLMRSMHKKSSCHCCGTANYSICGMCKKNTCGNCIAQHHAKKHSKNNIHSDRIHMPF